MSAGMSASSLPTDLAITVTAADIACVLYAMLFRIEFLAAGERLRFRRSLNMSRHVVRAARTPA